MLARLSLDRLAAANTFMVMHWTTVWWCWVCMTVPPVDFRRPASSGQTMMSLYEIWLLQLGAAAQCSLVLLGAPRCCSSVRLGAVPSRHFQFVTIASSLSVFIILINELLKCFIQKADVIQAGVCLFRVSWDSSDGSAWIMLSLYCCDITPHWPEPCSLRRRAEETNRLTFRTFSHLAVRTLGTFLSFSFVFFLCFFTTRKFSSW